MNKPLRAGISMGAAVLAALLLDRILIMQGHLVSSPFREIPRLWQQTERVWEADSRSYAFMNAMGYLLAAALGFTLAWTLSVSAEQKEAEQRRAIAGEVIDEALKNVKKDLPISPEVEASVVQRFWIRLERAFKTNP
jgi:hypothetical protein